MKTGLYFGSFNPIHIGHLLVATHIREAAGLEEIWFVVSPQNPFKINAELADEQHRLEMVKLSIQDVTYFKAIDIEFQLEKPSYTHLTIKALLQEFPEHQFSLIIGEDNVAKFHEWKEADWILNNVDVLVYNRNIENKHIVSDTAAFKFYYLPLIDISSTIIRKRIKENRNIKYFTTDNSIDYIKNNKLYL